MMKDFASFLIRLMTAVVFTSLLISCQKISQNQPSMTQPVEHLGEDKQPI